MTILKIKNGKIELVNDRGVLQRAFAGDVIHGDINDKENLVAVVYKSGKVETLNERGMLQKNIVSSGAVYAKFYGEDIVVGYKDGKYELRANHGTLKRTL